MLTTVSSSIIVMPYWLRFMAAQSPVSGVGPPGRPTNGCPPPISGAAM
jgi:hypothetical protein